MLEKDILPYKGNIGILAFIFFWGGGFLSLLNLPFAEPSASFLGQVPSAPGTPSRHGLRLFRGGGEGVTDQSRSNLKCYSHQNSPGNTFILCHASFTMPDHAGPRGMSLGRPPGGEWPATRLQRHATQSTPPKIETPPPPRQPPLPPTKAGTAL